MTLRSRKALQSVALLLLFSVWQVYGQANLNEQSAVGRGAVPSKIRVKPVLGRLATVGDKPVVVHDSAVRSGATIISGSQLQTPEGARATVQWEYLGRLDIAPKTDLTLTFSEGNVEVDLITGCVILTTYEGTTGIIKTPQGTTNVIGPEKRSFIDVCTGERGGSPQIGQGAAIVAGAGTCWALNSSTPIIAAGGFNPLWLLGAAPFVAGGVYAISRDSRPAAASPSAPPGS